MNRKIIASLVAVGLVMGVSAVAPAFAQAGPSFNETFDSPTALQDHFDFGVSGQDTWNFPDGIKSWNGDHDRSDNVTTTCSGPTTPRTITVSGSTTSADLSQPFYWCAPSGAGSGHLMTAWNTVGYNHLWFAPKGTFTGTYKVCFDVNETTMSRRKWLEVQFVDVADATRYPAGMIQKISGVTVGATRGSGGFDLGYTNPIFQDPAGPSNMIFPQSGTQAGLMLEQFAPSFWDHQSHFTFRPNGQYVVAGVTDKAARYQQCLENADPFNVRLTQNTPSGVRTIIMPGQIPSEPVHVVFHDVNYNPPKDAPPENPDGTYNANVLTWHWDNIQVYATGSQQPPPSTTTSTPVTSPPTTTTTTVAPTTTPPTSTTLPPLVCPSGFTTSQRNWCLNVNAHIAALEAKVH